MLYKHYQNVELKGPSSLSWQRNALLSCETENVEMATMKEAKETNNKTNILLFGKSATIMEFCAFALSFTVVKTSAPNGP